MINLLPPKEKEKILLAFRRKLIVILLFFILFFLVCLSLVIFSVKFYIQKEIDSQLIIFNKMQQTFEKSEIQVFQKKISDINLNLVNLSNFYRDNVYLSGILENISNTIPPDIYLTGLSAVSFELSGKTLFKINISGFAQNREVLFEFKENLERENMFENIYFPSANWVKSTDINFYATFETR